MILPRANLQRVLGQRRSLPRHTHRAFSDSTELNNAFGNQIDALFRRVSHFIKQFMQGNKARSLHVPVSLFGLQLQVGAIGQPVGQDFDDLLTSFFRQIVLSLEHDSSFKVSGVRSRGHEAQPKQFSLLPAHGPALLCR